MESNLPDVDTDPTETSSNPELRPRGSHSPTRASPLGASTNRRESLSPARVDPLAPGNPGDSAAPTDMGIRHSSPSQPHAVGALQLGPLQIQTALYPETPRFAYAGPVQNYLAQTEPLSHQNLEQWLIVPRVSSAPLSSGAGMASAPPQWPSPWSATSSYTEFSHDFNFTSQNTSLHTPPPSSASQNWQPVDDFFAISSDRPLTLSTSANIPGLTELTHIHSASAESHGQVNFEPSRNVHAPVDRSFAVQPRPMSHTPQFDTGQTQGLQLSSEGSGVTAPFQWPPMHMQSAPGAPSLPARGNGGRHSLRQRPDRQAAVINMHPREQPVTTNLDENGVLWIEYSYSMHRQRDRFRMRCDIERIDPNTLSENFRVDNSVYPRAMVPLSEYHGHRYEYERACNNIGWQLAQLNEGLRGHRGLIQRAVDSYRNHSGDERTRSRRLRRISRLERPAEMGIDPLPRRTLRSSTIADRSRRISAGRVSSSPRPPPPRSREANATGTPPPRTNSTHLQVLGSPSVHARLSTIPQARAHSAEPQHSVRSMLIDRARSLPDLSIRPDNSEPSDIIHVGSPVGSARPTNLALDTRAHSLTPITPVRSSRARRRSSI